MSDGYLRLTQNINYQSCTRKEEGKSKPQSRQTVSNKYSRISFNFILWRFSLTVRSIEFSCYYNMSSSPLLPAPQMNSWNDSGQPAVTRIRRQLRRSLDSKAAHYSILLLVSLDVACLFAGISVIMASSAAATNFVLDLIIQLHICGRHHTKPFDEALAGLGIAGLVFSCLFMFELMASVWAFGLS